ncbi:MAG: hypothetical protein IPN90_04505 [Elusimicrobia bacterium]|nr:hypothetical protein [Elusimicrobiota bacterium]
MIRRYAQEAVLLFDPDPAGQNASWRSAAVFLKEDVFVRVAHVPGEQDPDEFVLDQGPALDLMLAKAQDVVDFWLDVLAPSLAGFNDFHGRLRRAEELMRFIAGVPNEVLREEWTRRAAARLSLDVDALRREMARQAAKGAGSGVRLKWRGRLGPRAPCANRRRRGFSNFGWEGRVGGGRNCRRSFFRHPVFDCVSPLAGTMEIPWVGGSGRGGGSRWARPTALGSRRFFWKEKNLMIRARRWRGVSKVWNCRRNGATAPGWNGRFWICWKDDEPATK